MPLFFSQNAQKCTFWFPGSLFRILATNFFRFFAFFAFFAFFRVFRVFRVFTIFRVFSCFFANFTRIFKSPCYSKLRVLFSSYCRTSDFLFSSFDFKLFLICRTFARLLNLEFFQLLLSTSDRLLRFGSGFWDSWILGFSDLGSGIWDLGSGISDLGFGRGILRSGIWDLGFWDLGFLRSRHF